MKREKICCFIFILLLFVLLTACGGNSFQMNLGMLKENGDIIAGIAPQCSPEEVRAAGIDLGADPIATEKHESEDLISTIYRCPEDAVDLSVAKKKVKDIHFQFFNEKLTNIHVYFQDESTYPAIHEKMVELYGEPKTTQMGENTIEVWMFEDEYIYVAQLQNSVAADGRWIGGSFQIGYLWYGTPKIPDFVLA